MIGTERETDVLVVGGGPAGTAAALTLAGRGLRSILVERADYSAQRIGETLPPDVRVPLARLGVWERFVAAGYLPSTGIRSAWGDARPYEQSFMFNPYANGWHVDRRAFDAMLAAAAVERGVRAIRNGRMRDRPAMRDGAWHAVVETGERTLSVTARFVIDAGGRGAHTARMLGARRIVHDRMVATYGYMQGPDGTGADHTGTSKVGATLIEAAEDGWWYSAPLPDGSAVCAFMTDADICSRLGLYRPERWLGLMGTAPLTNASMQGRLLRADPSVAAAGSVRVLPPVGDRWLAAGDAAFTMDPLSGQGVPRALNAGIRAAEAAQASLLGDTDAPAAYAAELGMAFDAYLITRAEYYRREMRWPDSLFWRRRHGKFRMRNGEYETASTRGGANAE